MRNRALATLLALAATATMTGVVGAAGPWERANVMSQLDPTTETRSLVAVDGAAILRSPHTLKAKLAMPTPEPGSYRYPQGPTASGEPGFPETFSLWAFVFFNPEACVGPCDGADLVGNPDVVAGAFNAGGHVVGGPNLILAGSVNHASPSFPLGLEHRTETLGEAFALGYDLEGAEIHLAVAPHGGLDPELLPESISTPVGTAADWWIALFSPRS